MALTRAELSKLLHASCDIVHEGFTPQDQHDATERIVYFDYIWEDVVTSGETFDVHVTYEVSVFSSTPHCKTLLKLRENLRKAGLHPVIYHEQNVEDRVWHSYMAVDTIGDLTETGE